MNANPPYRGLVECFDEWLRLAGLDRPLLAALVVGSADAASMDPVRNHRARTAMMWLCDPVDRRIPPLLLDIVKAHHRTVSEAAKHSVSHASRLGRATSALVDCATARERQAGRSRLGPEGAAPRAAELTPREYDILCHIGSARTNRQIATLLGISEKTVKNHLTSLFGKMQVSDRTEALVVALRDGLLPAYEGMGPKSHPAADGALPTPPGGADWDPRPMEADLAERSH